MGVVKTPVAFETSVDAQSWCTEKGKEAVQLLKSVDKREVGIATKFDRSWTR